MTPKAMIGALFDPQVRYVFILNIAQTCVFGAGAGALGILLYTEQWGYSTQEFGTNIAIGAMINIPLVMIAGVLADRCDRIRVYQYSVMAMIVLQVCYLVYVLGVLPDQRPSLVEMLLFGELGAVAGMMAGAVIGPMTMDYIVRNKLGTAQAGAGLITHLLTFAFTNGVAIFIAQVSAHTMPPAGEMARVVLAQDTARSVVERRLADAAWIDPISNLPATTPALFVKTWFANGVVRDAGTCFEVRWADPNSERLLVSERAKHIEHRDAAKAELAKASSADAAARLAAAEGHLAGISATLAARAETFRSQVFAQLGDVLLTEGDQIKGASTTGSALVLYVVDPHISSQRAERLLKTLRAADTDTIDVRPWVVDGQRGFAVARRLTPVDDSVTVERDLLTRLAMPASGAVLRRVVRPMMSLDLDTVEEALEQAPSPVSRAVLAIEGVFGAEAPPRDRRPAAAAKGLRGVAGVEHARLVAREDGRGIRVLVVPAGPETPVNLRPSSATRSADARDPALRARLVALVGDQPEVDALLQLYRTAETTADGQRLTISRPLLKSEVAPRMYNYFVMFYWTLAFVIVGLVLTFVFRNLERRGLVQKRGREEAES